MGICGSSEREQTIVPVYFQEIKEGKLFQDNTKSKLSNENQQNNSSLSFQFKESSPNSNKNIFSSKNLPLNFKRRDLSHMTVLPSKQQPFKRQLQNTQNSQNTQNTQNSNPKTFQTSNTNNETYSKREENTFQRRNKKSTTLVERSKSSAIFAEELKLCVLKQTIIGDSGNNPLLKYQIIRKLGEGSY